MDVVAAEMLPPPDRSWVTSSWMEVVSAAKLAALDTSGSSGGPATAWDLVDMMDAIQIER